MCTKADLCQTCFIIENCYWKSKNNIQADHLWTVLWWTTQGERHRPIAVLLDALLGYVNQDEPLHMKLRYQDAHYASTSTLYTLPSNAWLGCKNWFRHSLLWGDRLLWKAKGLVWPKLIIYNVLAHVLASFYYELWLIFWFLSGTFLSQISHCQAQLKQASLA